MNQPTGSPDQPIDTRRADRRPLRLATMDQAQAEVDRLGRALQAGTLTHTGNWTPGEVFDHLARFFALAYDGSPTRAPAPMRWIARALLLRRATTGDEPLPAGFRLPQKASALLPEPGVDDGEGLARLRAQLARVQRGERMTQPSPLLGPLTHRQWVALQCKHMALHLAFLHPGEAPSAPAGGGVGP